MWIIQIFASKMKKRNKRKGSKSKNTANTTIASPGETASNSETSSENTCDTSSSMKVEIEMPRVYGTSNSLLGTFGLLNAQKPEVRGIKKEPAEVDSLKTSDPLLLKAKDAGEVGMFRCSTPGKNFRIREVSVVLEDVMNSIKIPDEKEEGIKERVTDANDNLVIIGEFCVEKDNEDMLDTVNVKMADNCLVRKDKEDCADEVITQRIITNENLVFRDEVSAAKDRKDVLVTDNIINIIKQEDNDANINVPNVNELPMEEGYSNKEINRMVANAKENFICESEIFVDNDTETEIMEHEESDSKVFSVKTNKQAFSNNVNEARMLKEKVTDANENFARNGDSSAEKSNEDVLEILNGVKKQEDSYADRNKASIHVGNNNEIFVNLSVDMNEDFMVNNTIVLNTVAAGAEQNASLCNMSEDIEIFNEFPVESANSSFSNRVTEIMELEENDAVEDIEIIEEVCRICRRRKRSSQGFCSHFPLIVE